MSGIFQKYGSAVACGIAGSFASLFGKLGFQQTNWIYEKMEKQKLALVFSWSLRLGFVLLMICANIKMIEYKIRSFSKIGSSLTVILGFFIGYGLGTLFEIFIWSQYPNWSQYVGCFIIFIAIILLCHDVKLPVERRKSFQEVWTNEDLPLIENKKSEDNLYSLNDNKENTHIIVEEKPDVKEKI